MTMTREEALAAAPKEGQRIRLVKMGDDPCPMQPGAEGVVASRVYCGNGQVHLNMEWDRSTTDRNLNLEWPIDEVAVLDV